MRLLLTAMAISMIIACTPPTKKDEKAKGKAPSGASKGPVFAGEYSYGPGADKGRSGNIIIFPNNDSTLLFAIDLSIGPPSYNMGSLFDTLKIKDHQAIYKTSPYSDKGCKWQIYFYGDSLTIKTLDNGDDCGFGGSVIADGNYKLVSRKIPRTYVTQDGDTLYRAK